MSLPGTTLCHPDKKHKAYGMCVACHSRWLRAGKPALSAPKTQPTILDKTPTLSADLQRLVDTVRKPGGKTFEELCNSMGKTPGAMRTLLAASDAAGLRLKLGTDRVQLSAAEQIRTVQETAILPTTGKRQTIGIISDLHLGSKYCLRKQIQDCVIWLHNRGVSEILVPGDWLDGCYKHGVFELSHTGLTDQTQDLFETLPTITGLSYHGITGNHDFTFTEATGVNVGGYITGYFAERGRKDVHFYGDCGAFLKIRGAVVHLWHPLGGMSYAKSYKLQKQIEKYGAGEKPDILIGGHVHQFALVEDRGIFAMLCPTFQASGSAFSKRLGGQPALGGLLLGWDVTTTGMIRNFSVERRRYYEVEEAQHVR